MPCAHGNMNDRRVSMSSSSSLTCVSNLLIKRKPEPTEPYFTRKKRRRMCQEFNMPTPLTTKLQTTTTVFSSSPKKLLPCDSSKFHFCWSHMGQSLQGILRYQMPILYKLLLFLYLQKSLPERFWC